MLPTVFAHGLYDEGIRVYGADVARSELPGSQEGEAGPWFEDEHIMISAQTKGKAGGEGEDESEFGFVRFIGYCEEVACINRDACLLRQRVEVRKAQAWREPDSRTLEEINARVRAVCRPDLLGAGELQGERKGLVG